MIKKLFAIVLPVVLLAGISIAQEKTEKPVAKAEKNPIVKFQTNYGDFYLEVFLKETPIHAKNFLSKVEAGKYNGLIFHRILEGFVVQGGSPDSSGSGSMGTDRPADEKSPFPEVRGTVAMARSPLGASDCQFFINLSDHTIGSKPDLDSQGFSAFAKVISGMDVVDKISMVEVGASGRPVKDVTMIKVSKVDKVSEAKAQ